MLSTWSSIYIRPYYRIFLLPILLFFVFPLLFLLFLFPLIETCKVFLISLWTKTQVVTTGDPAWVLMIRHQSGEHRQSEEMCNAESVFAFPIHDLMPQCLPTDCNQGARSIRKSGISLRHMELGLFMMSTTIEQVKPWCMTKSIPVRRSTPVCDDWHAREDGGPVLDIGHWSQCLLSLLGWFGVDFWSLLQRGFGFGWFGKLKVPARVLL